MRNLVVEGICSEKHAIHVRWRNFWLQITPALEGSMEGHFHRNHLRTQVNVPGWRAVFLISLAKIDDFLPATEPALDDPV